MVPQAIKDNVICKDAPVDNKTKGGLYIPETAGPRLPQKICIVISIGEECTSDIEPGDTIMAHTNAGQAVWIDGEAFGVFKEGEIYGIVSKGKKD